MSGRLPDLDALEAQARALLASDRVTEPTRRVLAARLDHAPEESRLITGRRMQTLRAVAARLIPLGELQERVDLAGRLDAALADGPGGGWRYAELPPIADAIVQGLDALDCDAGPAGFAASPPERQDALLAAAQKGATHWPLSSALWFEELLTAMVRLAYGHPLVQLDIGYDGMADAQGFERTDFTGG